MKMPPIEKIYEAYSVIADKRYELGGRSALVFSSDYSKTYTVTWIDQLYTSNDAATYWQGYPGYPILVVLLLQGKLPLTEEVMKKFEGIDWDQINKKHKRNYANAVKEVMMIKNLNDKIAQREVHKIYRELELLSLSIRRSSLKPPK